MSILYMWAQLTAAFSSGLPMRSLVILCRRPNRHFCAAFNYRQLYFPSYSISCPKKENTLNTEPVQRSRCHYFLLFIRLFCYCYRCNVRIYTLIPVQETFQVNLVANLQVLHCSVYVCGIVAQVGFNRKRVYLPIQ